MKNHGMVAFFVLVGAGVGCTQAEVGGETETPLIDIEERTGEIDQALLTATFSGVVRNEQGNPVPGVTVSINSVVATTDASGYYSRSILASSSGYNIQLSKVGFAPAFEVSLTGKLNAIHVLRAAEIKQIDPTQTNTITSSKGAVVTIPANSLVDASGTLVTGPVNIALATYDHQTMPGDNTATNAAGQAVALDTVGALSVNATSAASGAELQLKTGVVATATIPVPPSVGAMPACVAAGTCNLKVWRLESGRWVEKPANRTFTSTSTTFVMTRGGGGFADNGGLGIWNADIEKTAPACTVVQFVGIPQECYRPPNTPSTASDPGITLTAQVPYSSGTPIVTKSHQIPLSVPFVALYNISANAMQNVSVTFPAGAPAYCAANLEIISDAAAAPGYPNYTSTGGTTRFNSGAPWGGVGKPLATGTSSAITLADVTADPPRDPCKSHVAFVGSNAAPPAMKNAMTWTMLSQAQANASNVYARPGSDAKTNPYQGDTWTKNELPLLCIKKPSPLLSSPGTSVIGSPYQTPGGAWRATWSGGSLAATTPVKGASLTSRATADALCASTFGVGYRMAEFHDGDPNLWSGWDFWGQVYGANLTPFQGWRFWVAINDQSANPW